MTTIKSGEHRSTTPTQLDFFPISVWYSGGKARAPMLSPLTASSREEWQRDLNRIRALGFNAVRTWVEWAHCEPRPGEYHFENLELLLDLAHEEGLRVLIQMYVDSAPDWVPRQFPDALFEAQSGEKVPPQAAPGCCVDHAGVAEAVNRFYTETARVAAARPAFYAWDLWSEPHIINWAIIQYVPNAQFCFCPYTRKRFQAWLKDKYRTLDELNRAWYRNLDSWEEAQPPRFGTILSYTDFIDWKNFIYDKLAEDLRDRYNAIRKADPSHVITSHAAVPSVFTSPFGGDGEADDFLMARQVDFYGTSLYPKHSFPKTHWERWKLQLAIDFSRCANRPNGGFYVGELQAGFGTRGVVVGDPVTADDHRIWLWSAVAGGARGVNFFSYYPMASGYESGGYGLVELDGALTERARESGRIAATIDRHKELFLQSRPLQAQIALLYNPLAQMVGGEQNCGPANALRDSLVGYWRIFREANIPVDFVHRTDLEQGRLDGYRLLILPFPVMFTPEAARGLRQFVERGGYAVAEARLGWNDDRGFAAEVIPGMGLSEVFGVRESKVKMDDRIAMNRAEGRHPLLEGLAPDAQLEGCFFGESIDLREDRPAQLLARLKDGSPAVAASSYGKGKTLFIGSFLGLASHQAPHEANTHFILNLAKWAEISTPLRTELHGAEPGAIDLRLQENPEGLLLFALNHSHSHRRVSLVLETPKESSGAVQELTEESPVHFKTTHTGLEWHFDLEARGVKVFRVVKK